MCFSIRLAVYSCVLGAFLFSGVAFAAQTTTDPKKSAEQCVKDGETLAAMKTKDECVRNGGAWAKIEKAKLPADSFDKSKVKRPDERLDTNKTMPVDPLEKNKTKLPDDPIDLNANKTNLPDDQLNKIKTMRPPDPLEDNKAMPPGDFGTDK